MPTSSTPGDRASRDAIVTALIASDPEMHALAREYVMAGLGEMLHQLKRGDAATRASIARAMSGVVASLFTQREADDGLGDLRVEMHEMMEEMREGIGAHEDRDNATTGVTTDEELVEQHRVMVPKS